MEAFDNKFDKMQKLLAHVAGIRKSRLGSLRPQMEAFDKECHKESKLLAQVARIRKSGVETAAPTENI